MSSLKTQFFAEVKKMEEEVGGEDKFYIVKYSEDGFGIPMNVIYKARNPYGVWLQAYEYLRSKDVKFADEFFYCEDVFTNVSEGMEAIFESFIRGDTLWCEEVTLYQPL